MTTLKEFLLLIGDDLPPEKEAAKRKEVARWLRDIDEAKRRREQNAEWLAIYRDVEREAARRGVPAALLMDQLRAEIKRRAASGQTVRLETKAAVEVYEVKSGLATFKGYLSVFGNEDMTGDIVEHGAYKATIAEVKARPLSDRFLLPVLLQHAMDKPVGGFTDLREDIHGLSFTAELDTKTRDGNDAYQAVKNGYLSGMSVGFITRKANYDHAGVRHLTDVKLIEGSLVTFPANDRARVSLIN